MLAARHFIDAQDFGSSLCWAIRANNDSICSEVPDFSLYILKTNSDSGEDIE
jgi:hypothetical protein